VQIFDDAAVVLLIGSALLAEGLVYGFCHEEEDCLSFGLEGQYSLPFFVDGIRNIS
jgi:hypothetical protein